MVKNLSLPGFQNVLTAAEKAVRRFHHEYEELGAYKTLGATKSKTMLLKVDLSIAKVLMTPKKNHLAWNNWRRLWSRQTL